MMPAGKPPRTVPPQFRAVAIPAAIALGAIGGIAAERVELPWIVGAAGGALAALLTVLALPSLPTRRVTVVLLGVGGLGALRHASFAGTGRSWLLIVWAAATMVTLVLVDRVDAETMPALPGGKPLAPRASESARTISLVSLLVIVAAVALVPPVTQRLSRQTWPGTEPDFGDIRDAPASLQATDELDVTSRPRLTDEIVFTVEAKRADFWRGQTFDLYEGSRWTRSSGNDILLDGTANGVVVPASDYDVGAVSGPEFRQTFNIEAGYSDVVFAAPSPRLIETDKPLRARSDGTVLVRQQFTPGFGKGAVYSVTSRSTETTGEMLQNADNEPMPQPILDQYATKPDTTDRVAALARSITAGEVTTIDKVRAIEAWLGANTEYSLDAPLSPNGVDIVDHFVFTSRLGWCEQIASSLVVLARAAGIPARLTTGFVPGERDALTGRFVVRERDAHAWAEVYFPGIGWQGFDPTAHVPLAGEAAAGGSLLDQARSNAIPLVLLTIVTLLGVLCAPVVTRRLRVRRTERTSWSARALRRLERVGAKAGRPRSPAETPREYARALADRLDDQRLVTVGAALDRDAYSAAGAPPEARDDADAVLTSLRP
jgi:transglutaminase-like putative cysteine protease